MLDVIGQDDPEDQERGRLAPAVSAVPRPVRRLAAVALLTAASGVLLAGTGALTPHRTPAAPDRRAHAQQAGPTAGSTPADAAPMPASTMPSIAEAARAAALRATLAVRPIGGDTVRTDAGARGDVRLEVRNAGAPLRLLSLTAEVPGVRFDPLVRPHGVDLDVEARIELVLGFEIDDCARLRRTGRVVLTVEQAGVQREVGLTITHDREAGTVRQVALDRVLVACPL